MDSSSSEQITGRPNTTVLSLFQFIKMIKYQNTKTCKIDEK